MPTTCTNITEIALKTIPSASKIEIKRVLESLYGFEVEKVRTLNMEGKKKKRGGLLLAKPDYKKAYVTLRNSLSISPNLFPIGIIEEERERMSKKKPESSFVDDNRIHWLDEKKKLTGGSGGAGGWRGIRGDRGGRSDRGRGRGDVVAEKAKFPWSSMRGAAANSR
ncbi:unnamed protein product [Dovyalis caffra]|uniref:Large ribosomal subunit protein uL23m n=1 Tax=Dovyalis caffra TaxID=77055 RepID=A0AAV1RI35_9ROSI|nr:unnamed protein product [Dovyalis caffra]